jgi:uridine kinase
MPSQTGAVSERAVMAAINMLTRDHGVPVLVAIDGRSGAGKSTLAARLAKLVDGVVVESDDFFSGGSDEEWAERTPEEKADRCIDWRRLRREALEPLLAGRAAEYRPFNFSTGFGLAEHIVRREAKQVVVLDGVYSGRPELAEIVDLAVLVEVSDDLARRQRLVDREGILFMTSWHALWDPAEDYYFAHMSPDHDSISSSPLTERTHLAAPLVCQVASADLRAPLSEHWEKGWA